MNAYRAYQRGERPKAPRNWLIAIAHNVCRQRFRQTARRPNEVALDEELAEAQPEQEGPSAEEIGRALGHLAFNQRAALVMRELEGRSYAEIAEILDTSVSAVETLLFRARRALREQLEESLTCVEAELAISRQLDGRLPRPGEGPAARPPPRVCGVRDVRPLPARAALGAEVARRGTAPGLARLVLRRRRRCRDRRPASLQRRCSLGAAAAVAAGVGVEGTRHHMWPKLVTPKHVAASQAAAAKPAPTATAKPKPKPALVAVQPCRVARSRRCETACRRTAAERHAAAQARRAREQRPRRPCDRGRPLRAQAATPAPVDADARGHTATAGRRPAGAREGAPRRRPRNVTRTRPLRRRRARAHVPARKHDAGAPAAAAAPPASHGPRQQRERQRKREQRRQRERRPGEEAALDAWYARSPGKERP